MLACKYFTLYIVISVLSANRRRSYYTWPYCYYQQSRVLQLLASMTPLLPSYDSVAVSLGSPSDVVAHSKVLEVTVELEHVDRQVESARLPRR